MITRDFDPLADFHGLWTTELAETYLPIPAAAPGTSFECVDGYLIMSPSEGSRNSWAMLELGSLLRGQARAAGHRVYGTLNVAFDRQTWIEPDLTVLRGPIKNEVWVRVEKVLVVGEFVSPSSKLRDRIDKPKMCAAAGVPFYLRVEVDDFDVHVELLQLHNGAYVSHAKALGGMTFETDDPFPMSFDPAVLLES
ncbi:MAG: Uma2 family endonuclease [Actinomycetota bacterium]|nr:Uma2 family endonuclease [Actinomycetota bacterium]